jgi:hypothetical protein
MAQTYSRGWTDHIWKILMVGGVFTFLGIILPSCAVLESGITLFMWYFGFWIMTDPTSDSGGASDFFLDPYDDKYMTIGVTSIVILIIALILMISAANILKADKNKGASAGLGIIGGILAIVGPAAYYFYIKDEFSGFWMTFDESFGFYLPIIGGILGIIGAIAAGYAYSLERKGPAQPMVGTVPSGGIPAQAAIPTTQEGKRYCSNCGAEVHGPFCQECGQKVE